MITIFKSLYETDKPHYITVEQALKRIKDGNSFDKVAEIRGYLDKEKRDRAKLNLPCVCFSGKFTERKASALIEHSGFMILDFDDVGLDFRDKLEACEYCYACWLSPSGNGFKMLIRIKDTEQHAAHFLSFQKNIFPEVDGSGKDVGRVCFESYDPEIYVNTEAKVYTSIYKEVVNYSASHNNRPVTTDEAFQNLLKWLTNKGGVFASGQRNHFIYRLASACCRFGIHEQDAVNLIGNEFLSRDTTFTQREAERTIKSAYKTNAGQSSTASFDNVNNLVAKVSGVEIDLKEIEEGITTVKDIIYSDDVKEDALRIVMQGYEAADSTGIDGLDFKLRKGDLTLLSGIGNYGKSTFWDYVMLTKTIKDGDKWGVFTPETFPASEFYHDKVEMYIGRPINGHINHEVDLDAYTKVYDYIGKHFFYCYPKDDAHTPEYILERFLELIIKEKITGVVIDPFNMLSNDYRQDGYRDDKYLERTLTIFSRFAKENGIYFVIVAHPKKIEKGKDGKNYDCPEVFDIAGGAMWNNKMDNILIYHRPLAQSDPQSKDAEFYKKKIRREKSVGKKGMVFLEFDFSRRRFYVENEAGVRVDYMQELLDKKRGVKTIQQDNPYAGIKQEGLYNIGDEPFK